ncbi:MAG: nuclear transport factor 2 family protein [Rhodococcus sp. (in: high G+C Gram-positive bacteria)]
MPTAEDLLTAVRGSPDAVAVHDRAAWIDLYAENGIVNDPVGSRPHRGRDAIERFYDTFIAPNTINFHVDHDVVSGMSVVRDLSLETIMSSGATLHVPMHLRYDLVEENGQLKIARLAAHWELSTMIGQLLSAGTRGLTASAGLTPALIRNQGLGGVVGFMGGLRGVGAKGKVAARDILRSSDSLRGAKYHKWIAAGRTVSASVDSDAGHGVVFVDFHDRSLRDYSIEVFTA